MNKSSSTAVAFAVGAAAGAVTALLASPRSGKENREYIKDASRRARDLAASKKSDLQEKGRTKLEQAKSTLRDKLEDASGKAEETVRKGQYKLEQQR